MKTLGIVGGIAPESTVDYYRSLIAAYRGQVVDASYPKLLINSIDLTRMLSLVREGRLPELTDYLLGAITQLAGAGADLALMASNTPHLVFDEVAQRSPVPLISIVECVAEAAQAAGVSRAGIFGTQFTMQGRFYPDVLLRHGVTLVLPTPDEQAFIHDRYMSELVEGRFLPETRASIVAVATRLFREEGIEALILGGTELPMLLRTASDCPIPLLDSTALHVRRAVQLMMAPA